MSKWPQRQTVNIFVGTMSMRSEIQGGISDHPSFDTVGTKWQNARIESQSTMLIDVEINASWKSDNNPSNKLKKWIPFVHFSIHRKQWSLCIAHCIDFISKTPPLRTFYSFMNYTYCIQLYPHCSTQELVRDPQSWYSLLVHCIYRNYRCFLSATIGTLWIKQSPRLRAAIQSIMTLVSWQPVPSLIQIQTTHSVERVQQWSTMNQQVPRSATGWCSPHPLQSVSRNIG